MRISRSRSPSPTRRHNHHHERLAVKIYEEDEDSQGNPPPRPPPPRIPDRHYISHTMQRLLKEQRRQQHYHCHSHRPSSPSSPRRCVSRREEEDEDEESVTLEDLVEAAFQACKRARQLAPRLSEAVGAALLCSNGDVFLGCSLGEGSACSSGSTERAILRKALRKGHCPPFQALVLAMDATRDPAAFPVPDKECFRHFGFLPIFLVNKNLDIHSTTSSAAARQAASPSPLPSPPPPPRRKVVVQDIIPPPPPPQPQQFSPRHVPCRSRSPLRRPPIPPPSSSASGPHAWSCSQVLDWLVQVVKLPQYMEDFKNARVDGHALFHIYSHEKATAGRASPQSKAYHRTHHYHAFSHWSSALEDTLHVYQPAHKKRLLVEIQKLKYGGCVPSAPRKAVPCPVQARRPEQTRRVVVRADGGRQHEEEEEDYDADDTSTLQRREQSVRAAAAAAAAAAGAVVQKNERAASRTSNPLKQLSRVKKVFDDSVATAAVGVGERSLLLDGTQALAGLRILGCGASQESVREYFTRRSIGLKRRDVSFYEFLRAALTLGGSSAGDWAKALPPSTTQSTTVATIKDEGPKKRKTSKKASKFFAAPPPRVSSSSYSSSNYSSSSSSSSCSLSQCSVSSLSEAEEEEEQVIKHNRVPSLLPTPPQAPSPPPPPPVPVVSAASTLLQPALLPQKPPIAAVAAAAPAPVAAPPRALAPLPLPAAPPRLEPSNAPLAPSPQQVPLPVSSPLKKVTLVPPLSTTTTTPIPTPLTTKQAQLEEQTPAPSKVEAALPATRLSPPHPPQPAPEIQKRQQNPPPTSPHQGQQASSRSARRRSSFSSSGSSSKSSKSSYSAPPPVAQALQQPSPPSIVSHSTSSSVSSIEQQQQQQLMPSSHARRGSGLNESVIHSILSEEDISGIHSPVTAPSSIPRFLSSPSSSSSSIFSSSPQPPPPTPPASLLEVGTKIEARYKGRERWFPGTVARVYQQEQAYDIHYDDDDVETHVSQDLVRPRSALQPSSPSLSSSSSSLVGSAMSLVFQKGDRVEARYRGRETFYSGVIGAVHAIDGSYEVHYDDGDVEERVAASLVRAVGGRV